MIFVGEHTRLVIPLLPKSPSPSVIENNLAESPRATRTRGVCYKIRVLVEKDEIADCCLVASALESGIRGSVQLMLELGLVDEAKEVTKTFMARWISI